MRGNDDDALTIAADGSVRSTGDGARQTLARAAGRYKPVALGSTMLLLRRSDDSRTRLLVAGEIVSRTTMMEAVSVIAQAQWDGELEVFGPTSQRRFRIAEGALKGAWSGVASERLGEVLVAAGLLTPHELTRCLSALNAKRRIGEVAMDLGFLNQEQLFEGLRLQLIRIFQNALLEDSGHYAMVRHDAEDSEGSGPALLLHMPIQGLLMESVQRIDEMALFRERIPSGDACPVMTSRAARISVGESLRPVLALADGDHSILEIARKLRSDEYQTTKRVAQLLQIGAVEIQAQKKLDEADALRMIARFNQVLRRIFDTVSRYGNHKDIHWTLDAWVRETALARFFEGALLPEGTIDAEVTVRRLTTMDTERPIDALHQALHELAAFAMLSAGSALPREAERSLSRLVEQKLAHLGRE